MSNSRPSPRQSVIANLFITPNDFKKGKKLGGGTFSSVFLAKKQGTEQYYALKEIKPYSDIYKLENAFVRELSVLINFDYPSVTRLCGFYIPKNIEKEKFIFLLEYCPNGDLCSRLHSECYNTLTPAKRMISAYGIAKTMERIHANDIIHRDLKPENIFLDENDYPKISDFGMSRFLKKDFDCKMTMNLGSPYYMAPELWLSSSGSDQPYDNKVDVYAFSMILLALFVDFFTFDGGSPKDTAELFRHIVFQGKRYIIPDHVPRPYKDLIRKCWDGDPTKRPSFEQIAQELKNFEKYRIGNADINEVRNYQVWLDTNLSRIDNRRHFDNDSDQKSETQPYNF